MSHENRKITMRVDSRPVERLIHQCARNVRGRRTEAGLAPRTAYLGGEAIMNLFQVLAMALVVWIMGIALANFLTGSASIDAPAPVVTAECGHLWMVDTGWVKVCNSEEIGQW